MAFQVPFNISSIPVSAIELLPAATSALSAPLKALRTSANRLKKKSSQKDQEEEELITVARVELPECLQSLPISALRLELPQGQGVVEGRFDDAKTMLLSVTQNGLLQARNALSRQELRRSARYYSTATRYRPKPSIIPPIRIRSTPRRTFFNRSALVLLSNLESAANNNPGNANYQSSFYSALLRANKPEILVERYETGIYATNAACEASYQKALDQLGYGRPDSAPDASGYSQRDLRAAAGAAAAKHSGGDTAYAQGGGSGARVTPLHVVVEESTPSQVFKWAKMILYFALVGYFCWVLLAMVAETIGPLKKVGSVQNNETQPQEQTARFKDVHGCEEAKDELQELVEFLINPDRFSSLGGKLPKGVLLVGPPGTGKTLLARAVAGEAGVPFFYMSGSEFDEVYVGVGAKRVRELFNQARAKAPSIIFIDELDAIGGKRNERDAAYVKQTLNQLLTELDGFSPSSGVIIIGATNYPQLLDKALTRPGRFDRRVVVPLPDVRGRMEILKHYMNNIKVSTEVDASVIARGTPGFSGAELENLVNQAAVHASRNKQKNVTPIDFEWAKDRLMMGAETRSRVIRDEDKLATAYHEVGHALVGLYTKGATPLYKMTIIPRGNALGVTHSLPEMDQVSQSYAQILAQIDVSIGGRVAEELIFGPEHVTTGISNDLSQATHYARALVTQVGYSEKLGNVDYDSDYEKLSSETKQLIEQEIRRIIEDGRKRVTKLLTERRSELELLAKALVEYETLTKPEIESIIRGEKLARSPTPKDIPIKIPEVLLPAELGGTPGGLQSTSATGPGQNQKRNNRTTSTSSSDPDTA
ncbi:MAG: hypothetical protein M1834_003113 [Cirrosporium novae-zelandiae]|nr:MAG: hypothetical protein M1834_003113 [Cirrosporium novae-zelandiae]